MATRLADIAMKVKSVDQFIRSIQSLDLLDEVYNWEHSTPALAKRYKFVGWFRIAADYWKLTREDGDGWAHNHAWGPVEHSRFTGNPHRKCTVTGCGEITLDLSDDEDE